MLNYNYSAGITIQNSKNVAKNFPFMSEEKIRNISPLKVETGLDHRFVHEQYLNPVTSMISFQTGLLFVYPSRKAEEGQRNTVFTSFGNKISLFKREGNLSR